MVHANWYSRTNYQKAEIGNSKLRIRKAPERAGQEAHLESHLTKLQANDHASRAIVAQMKDDEARHALDAQHAGALELPQPVKDLMRAAARNWDGSEPVRAVG